MHNLVESISLLPSKSNMQKIIALSNHLLFITERLHHFQATPVEVIRYSTQIAQAAQKLRNLLREEIGQDNIEFENDLECFNLADAVSQMYAYAFVLEGQMKKIEVRQKIIQDMLGYAQFIKNTFASN